MIVVSIGEATTAGSRPVLETTRTKLLAMNLEKNTEHTIVNETTAATKIPILSKNTHFKNTAEANVIPHIKPTRNSFHTTFA